MGTFVNIIDIRSGERGSYIMEECGPGTDIPKYEEVAEGPSNPRKRPCRYAVKHDLIALFLCWYKWCLRRLDSVSWDGRWI